MEWHKGEYTISTDRAKLDMEAISAYLTQEAYWAKGRAREVIERSIKHSENFGILHNGRGVGFARVVTDYATFAWLCDVYVLPAHRGKGLAKWLMETVMGHPELQGLKIWYLRTRDAHGLYSQFGFTPLSDPSRSMERYRPPQ